mgnify:CR=1 FL=1
MEYVIIFIMSAIFVYGLRLGLFGLRPFEEDERL